MTAPVVTEMDLAADALVRTLRTAEDVVLVAHLSPDADSLGSALALGLALRDLGLPAVVSVGEPGFVPSRSLAWLPGIDQLLVPMTQVPASPDVVVALDASSLDRLGGLAPVFAAARVRAVVDHHPTYTGYGDLHVVDAHAPATALLALDLVDRLGAVLTADIATCLYAGLITDTGSFRFAGTGPGTHLVAARLLAAGVRPEQVARRVYDDVPLAEVQLVADALARAELDALGAAGLGLVHTTVSLDHRAAAGLSLDSAEAVVESLRSVAEAEVAAVLKQADDGCWRVSLRSGGRVDVGAVAAAFGGGGHRAAGGFSACDDATVVLANLRARLHETGAAGAAD